MVTMELLRKIPVFYGIDDDPLRDMGHICRITECAPGETIFRQGELATRICYLIDGSVEIRMNEDRKSKPSELGSVVSRIAPGECFGWSALVPPNLYTASALARTRSTVLVIDGAGLESYMRGSRDLCISVFQNLARTISERLSDTRRQLLSAHLLNADMAGC